MAESSWPDPANGRVVGDAEWEVTATAMAPAGGVLGDFTNPALVYGDSSGRQVKIAAGRFALIRGHVWTSGASIITKTIAANVSGSTRTDLVVLRFSRTTYNAAITVITGTPGAGAPSPVQDAGSTGSWDLPLATVTVANGAATISAGNVSYVATHVGGDGGLRVPSVAAMAYIPGPYIGQQAAMDNGEVYSRNTSGVWVPLTQNTVNTYNPTLTGASGNPNLGSSGGILGEYNIVDGKWCHYRGSFWFGGSGIAPGAGQLSVTMPFSCAGTIPNGVTTGTMMLRDTGTLLGIGVCFIAANANTMSFYSITSTGQGTVTGTSPFTWATSDYLSWDVTYRMS